MTSDGNLLWLTEPPKSLSAVLNSEAMLYGIGLFETLYANEATVEKLPWHIERLSRGAQTMGIIIPDSLKHLSTLTSIIERYLKENQLTHPVALRMNLIKSGQSALCWMTTRPFVYTAEQYRKGLRLNTAVSNLASADSMSPFKTNNYLRHWHARQQSIGLGCDEILWLNSQGCLCEGSVSNVFFVKNNRWHTPHETCGLLPGLMRKQLMIELEAAGIVVERGFFSIEDIEKSDFVFVTNALMGVMPVSRIDQNKFPVSETFTKQLMAMLGVTRFD